MSDKSDKLLILDLDETLIHATANQVDIQEDHRFDKYFIYKRPHLDNFLINISSHFTLGIWSSAGDEYVNEIVKLITPAQVQFELVWGRSKCSLKRDNTFDTYFFSKKLDKLKSKGFKLEKILIVDDSPEKASNNYGNAIYIKQYVGDKTDTELLLLNDYLLTLKDVENVRQIEKRNWRKLTGSP
jgi:carboxy-terminal domain RNA polymerase II polypeptide A small phosphatase